MQTEKVTTERIITPDNGNAKGVTSQQYMHTKQAAAEVPLLQSIITGAMIGLAVFGMLQYFRVPDAWIIGLVVWMVVQALTWLGLGMHWITLSLAALEIIFKRDINGDGVIGKPKGMTPRVVQVNLRTVRENGHLTATSILRFPGEPEAMVMLATALLGGASMAERVWSGDGKLFSKDDYRAIGKIMDDPNHKLREPINPKDVRQGFQLTDVGRQTMQEVRETYMSNSPPPLGEDA